MASPVFGFAPEERARIRAVDKSADLYTCICAQPEPTAHLQRFTAWLTAMRRQSRLVDVPELLQTVSPEIAVISVGADNSYGHPAEDTLRRLARAGCAIYRTDRHGNVYFSFQ